MRPGVISSAVTHDGTYGTTWSGCRRGRHRCSAGCSTVPAGRTTLPLHPHTFDNRASAAVAHRTQWSPCGATTTSLGGLAAYERGRNVSGCSDTR